MTIQKDYSDIIHLPHHVSKVHPRMKMSDRAAQFSPFAALTGHNDAIKETARLVDEKLDLDDSQKEAINKTLNYLKDHFKDHLEVAMTYFQSDDKKIGGTYVNITDKVKKINDFEHMILLESGMKIVFEDIYDIHINKSVF